jgi:L-alanine-DL-glutamate epimerase-like enolase superfamily enzyme
MGPFTSAGLATILLADEDGQEGEAPITDLHSLENVLLPALLKGQRRPYLEIFESLYWRIRNAGNRGPVAGALGALDLALHDLASRRVGLPLHRFLGARTDRVPGLRLGCLWSRSDSRPRRAERADRKPPPLLMP